MQFNLSLVKNINMKISDEQRLIYIEKQITEHIKGLDPLYRSVAQDCCTLGHCTHGPTVRS